MISRLSDDLETWLTDARLRAVTLNPVPSLDRYGVVQHVGDGVALISGLPDACQDELLDLGDGVVGLAISLQRDQIGCILLSPWDNVTAGARVRGSGTVVAVPVGEEMLGRVIDPLGRPLDDEGPIQAGHKEPVDKDAPEIIDRDLVRQPLQTGLLVIDAMIPLGRGQRELIIGDRKTGKTAIALDTMINQQDTDVICIYAAVGQKSSSVNHVIQAVREYGDPESSIFVIGEAESPPGLQWLAPYSAMSIAESFAAHGKHVLVVIDDLTKHAAIYRELSLLLRRPPGREAYPGDIFHVHARLLERAAKLSEDLGGGSITALPIAETQARNLTAYIPTNLISITDGQIILEPRLFNEGQKPAIDIGKSVSRVGGKTQSKALRDSAERLRLDYAQFLELEVFTRFGAMVDERTQKAVEHGKRIRSILVQPQYRPFTLSMQVALVIALESGTLDRLSLEQIEDFRQNLSRWLAANCREISDGIDETGELSDEQRAELTAQLNGLADSIIGN